MRVKKILSIASLISWLPVGLLAQNYDNDCALQIGTNTINGGLTSIKISGDSNNMDWLTKTDGSQYHWVTAKYTWGLGYFTRAKHEDVQTFQWDDKCIKSISDNQIIYEIGGVRVTVSREFKNGELRESYSFTNIEPWGIFHLSDIGIYTPFNDNYPNSGECIPRRCNVHIWDGGSSAYVCALRMGGYGPHLGLVLNGGEIDGYDVWGRYIHWGAQHQRGVFALCPPNISLDAGETYTISWTLFSHKGMDDFYAKIREKGIVSVNAERYTIERGDKVNIITTNLPKEVKVSLNGAVLDESLYKKESCDNGTIFFDIKLTQCGEQRIEFDWHENGVRKRTHADIFVVEDVNELMAKRTEFILYRQRMEDRNDPRYGAFMVYDNEADTIYPNDTPNCNPVDRDEGAERLGMGVFLAQQYLRGAKSGLSKSCRGDLYNALIDYATFIREKLQTKDYKTFSSVDQMNRNRAYNYMWVAEYYFMMYKITNNDDYVLHGYNTLKSMYNQFGHNFYAIGIPVEISVECLKDAGLTNELSDIMVDYRKMGETFMKNGVNYPMSEVNYEQSIVAPSLQFLFQLYLVTNDKIYFDSAVSQMPVLEAFNGLQPSHRLNEVAIRHWDGYWFGKREYFGDTFPHYWSTLTGDVYSLYVKCIEKSSPEVAKLYRYKAEKVVEGNLSLFSEDGRGYCAYMYPKRMNGAVGRFSDPYSNDQDWALVYYLKVMER